MMCEFAIQLQSRKTRYDAYETVAEYPSVGGEQIGAHLPMSGTDQLLQPNQCALLLIDQQAGLAFGVGSLDRQTLLNNTIALVKTAAVFGVPVVVSTSASRVYSGPLMPAVHAALPDVPIIERRSMNVWEDDAARAAVVNTGRPRLIMSGLLTEACVTFAALSALADGYEVFVVGDACGGLTGAGHELALQRMAASGVRMTSWIQFLLELQRDWTRHETYDGARAIVEAHGGGYGIGLSYARDMIRPL
jgi:nicotinamidase-related amidase